MKKFFKITLAILGTLIVIAVSGAGIMTRSEAHRLITNPIADRRLPTDTPADHNLPFEEVIVIAKDGIKVVGWFIPSQNGATIIAQHGYKGTRGEMLNEAEMLYRHGYGVLITSVRAHDHSEGEVISFGYYEMQDLDAWYAYLISRSDVDPARVGMLGNSLGGSLVIQYAATNPGIRAVIANSAFSSLDDTINTSVERFTGLPAFPFAPMIVFWAENELGLETSEINAKAWIGSISPRPIFLMQGGADQTVSASSGQLLYDAAKEPKTLWYEPNIGHTAFDRDMPQEYERRVIEFFDRYLK